MTTTMTFRILAILACVAILIYAKIVHFDEAKRKRNAWRRL